eukprot:69962_1
MAFVTTNAYINPQETKTNQKQQKKRKRAVRNAFIQLDDVKETAGDNYINWIKITKQKLLERESKLMSLRGNILQTLISEQIKQFKIINERMKIYIDRQLYENIINKELIHNCVEKLNNKLLIPWNGIVLNHTKNTFGTFKKYFSTSRSWFDQRKRAILAQYLWIPIFDNIQQFTKIAAKRYFNERFILLQSLFVSSLTLQIATYVFKQKIKLPSTRPHSLISCSILKECHMFQLYLKKNVDKNILVNRLLQKNPDMSAVTLMGLIIDELQAISKRETASFQHDVYQLYDEFNFTPVYVEPLTDYSNVNNSNGNININNFNGNININNFNENININNNNNVIYDTNCPVHNNDNMTQISSITNDLFLPEMSTSSNFETDYYGPYHSQSYSVISERFSPLI